MPTFQMNWKTKKFEPCIDPHLKRGQIVIGIDGPCSENKGVILSHIENERYGAFHLILWIDDLHVSSSQYIKPIAEQFGIGDYYCPGEFMPETEIIELEKRFQAKEEVEAAKAEKRRLENERFSAIGKELFEAAIQKHGKPAALILAIEHEDLSDSQTDYFGFKAVRTVVLAFSKHKRNLFPEMRKAALNSDNPAIRKFATAPDSWENREDYSGGYGYYLAETKYSGWFIEKMPLYNEESLSEFYCNAGKPDGFCVK